MASEILERKVELAWLVAFYGGMLTEKQRQVLAMHCEEDMSLGEIAAEAGISRQGVHDLIKRCSQALAGYEEKLHLVERFMSVKKRVEQIDELLDRYGTDRDEAVLQRIREISGKIIEEL